MLRPHKGFPCDLHSPLNHHTQRCRAKLHRLRRNISVFTVSSLRLTVNHFPAQTPKTDLTFIHSMAITLSVRPNRAFLGRNTTGSDFPRPPVQSSLHRWWRGVVIPSRRTLSKSTTLVLAGSRADDSAPFEMSVENALKLLGVSEGASFDDILRAKKSIVAACKDDQETIAQVEAAYDMLLMQSLTQRRAGKVISSSVRYADVKPVSTPGMGSMPQWLQVAVKNSSVSIETPATSDLGIQAGVYGTLMALTYVNGTSIPSSGVYAGADVPGLILATSFGASLYFMSKRNVKLGRATVITVGGLVAGAVVGSVVENWLQVDIVPFLGIRSPAAIVSELIIVSQLLVSLYLR